MTQPLLPCQTSLRFAQLNPHGPIAWVPAPAQLPALRSDTHLWLLSLDAVTDAEREPLEAVLDKTERARCAKLRSPIQKQRFIACHGLLRHVLARYLSIAAGSIEFSTEYAGKPKIKGNSSAPAFNLSHSADTGLIAVNNETSVGIDLEQVNSAPLDVLSISRRYFHPNEVRALLQAVPERRHALFLELWTRKEAVLKARGEGLSGLHELAKMMYSTPIRSFSPTPGTIASLAWAKSRAA